MSVKVPRILLVSGVPPGCGNVGEIILRDICLNYPSDHISCFVVPTDKYFTSPDPALNNLPVQIRTRRYEVPYRLLPGKLGALTALVSSQIHFKRYVNELTSEAASFGRKQKVEKVLMVLESPTMIAMGNSVAEALKVPLLALIWDPPGYLLRERGYDRLTCSVLMQRFVKTIQKAERVAVVSETMQEDYRRLYGANTMILRHGLAYNPQCESFIKMEDNGKFVIGFAGTLYGQSAWDGLMNALESIDWFINGRQIVIRVLGSYFRFSSRSKANIEYLGFRSTFETASVLADCDINYLPYPFDESLYDLAHYAFPSKLGTYVAAGKPVFIHAPEYSSLTRFFNEYPVGSCCNSLKPADIVAELLKFSNCDYYLKASSIVSYVAKNKLNIEEFRRQFAEFIGIDREMLLSSGSS